MHPHTVNRPNMQHSATQPFNHPTTQTPVRSLIPSIRTFHAALDQPRMLAIINCPWHVETIVQTL
eukprot:5275179-Lingulodinium_polyedra.AAC.1